MFTILIDLAMDIWNRGKSINIASAIFRVANNFGVLADDRQPDPSSEVQNHFKARRFSSRARPNTKQNLDAHLDISCVK